MNISFKPVPKNKVDLTGFTSFDLKCWVFTKYSLYARASNVFAKAKLLNAEELKRIGDPLLSDVIKAINAKDKETDLVFGSRLTEAATYTAKQVSVGDDGRLQLYNDEDNQIALNLYRGFAEVPLETVQSIGKIGIRTDATPQFLIQSAVLIADFVTIVDDKFLPKRYTTPIMGASQEFANAANNIAAQLTDSLQLNKVDITTKSYKGTALVDALLPPLLSLARGKKPLLAQLSKAIREDLPSPKALQIKSQIGDYTITQEPFLYAAAVLDAMRGIRGGDKNDNTPQGLSWYLPVTMPRDLVKALALAKDLLTLRALLKRDVLFLVGNKADKRIRLLAVSNVYSGLIGAVCVPPAGFEQQEDGTYTRKGSAMIFVTERPDNALDINFDVPLPRKHISGVYEVALTQTTFDKALPSCLVHNLRGYYYPALAMNLDPLSWCRGVVAVNVNRTFSYVGLTWPELVHRHQIFKNFQMKYTAIARLLSDIGVRYDEAIMCGTGIADHFAKLPDDFGIGPQSGPILHNGYDGDADDYEDEHVIPLDQVPTNDAFDLAVANLNV